MCVCACACVCAHVRACVRVLKSAGKQYVCVCARVCRRPPGERSYRAHGETATLSRSTSGAFESVPANGKWPTLLLLSNATELQFTDFDKYSLSNVEAGSPKMWVHLVSMYVVAIFTMAVSGGGSIR